MMQGLGPAGVQFPQTNNRRSKYSLEDGIVETKNKNRRKIDREKGGLFKKEYVERGGGGAEREAATRTLPNRSKTSFL